MQIARELKALPMAPRLLLVSIIIGVTGATLAGAWQGETFWLGTRQAAIYGVVVLWLGGALFGLITQRQTWFFRVAVPGLGPTLLLAGAWGLTVPNFVLGLYLSDVPIEMNLSQLFLVEADMPQHIRLQGQLQPELTLSGPNANGNFIYRTPLVDADWQPGFPVLVLVDGQPESLIVEPAPTSEALPLITGVLYRLIPTPTERSFSDMTVEQQIAWHGERVRFSFDPYQAYILRQEDLSSYETQFYGMVAIVGLLLLALCGWIIR